MVSAQPQLVPGIGPVWPEKWGVTLGQLRDLLDECRCDPNWNSANSVRTLVEQYIIPKTRGHGIGYALMVNQDEPKEVSVMVSHSWNENFEEFVDVLERTVHQDEILFICALAIYQCGDGAGPNVEEQIGDDPHESPFVRTLSNIRRKGKLAGCLWSPRGLLRQIPWRCMQMMILLHVASIITCGGLPMYRREKNLAAHMDTETRSWSFTEAPDSCVVILPCVSASLACTLLATIALRFTKVYEGRMVAVPNRQDDLYSRLWCVYEMFVATQLGIHVQLARTLAAAGKCSCRDAVCSNESDKRRIFAEIERYGKAPSRCNVFMVTCPEAGYRRVDRAIRRTTRRARWAVTRAMGIQLFAVVSFYVGFNFAFGRTEDRITAACATVVAFVTFAAFWLALALPICRHRANLAARGRIRPGQLVYLVGAPVLLGAVLLQIFGIRMEDVTSPEQVFGQDLGIFLLQSGCTVGMAPLTVLKKYIRRWRMVFFTAVFWAATAINTVAWCLWAEHPLYFVQFVNFDSVWHGYATANLIISSMSAPVLSIVLWSALLEWGVEWHSISPDKEFPKWPLVSRAHTSLSSESLESGDSELTSDSDTSSSDQEDK
mmetsp:Transcript_81892/g.210980  ORF Transcript_81892/g.210980 Transcript_81892/m.210980 type:complete len:603 (-) Transcript_81892:94-1902(-)